MFFLVFFTGYEKQETGSWHFDSPAFQKPETSLLESG